MTALSEMPPPPILSVAGHMRRIAVLGLPLIGSHVAQFAISLTDAVMLGWYDVGALAAQVLGGQLFFLFFLVGSGFAWGAMALVAQAGGAGDRAEARRATRMAAWLSGLFAVLTMPVFLTADPLLRAIGQQPETAALAGDYLAWQGWSIFPALGVMVLKSTLAGLERTQVVLWVTLAALVVNGAANYALIFGNWGMPEMGIRGAAIASLASTALSAVVLTLYAWRALPDYDLFARFWRFDAAAFGTVFRLGWPIGLTSLAETGLFAASSVMMGWIGTVALAAHGIALQVVSAMFMIHVGLSNVATIRAGNAVGRGEPRDLRRGAQVVTGIAMAVALATAVVFLVVPEVLIAGFVDPGDPARGEVMRIGIVLLAAAALFQVADAAQIMALGLLRGVSDTRAPMVIAAVSYWVVGVPLGYALGFVAGFEGPGIWLGMGVGLALAAAAMMWRFWTRGVYALSGGLVSTGPLSNGSSG